MKIVIQGAHCETMASNLIVNVIVHCRRTRDQVERIAGEALKIRGVLNPISVVFAFLSNQK